MKKVWLMCGIPASGKSTWAREHQEMFGGVIVSRDEIRFSIVKDDEEYFSHEDGTKVLTFPYEVGSVQTEPKQTWSYHPNREESQGVKQQGGR